MLHTPPIYNITVFFPSYFGHDKKIQTIRGLLKALRKTPDFQQRFCVASMANPASPTNTPSQLLAIAYYTTSSISGDLLHQQSEDTNRLHSPTQRISRSLLYVAQQINCM